MAKKKVVKKVAPEKNKTSEPSVNMGKGISNITCPSCEKVHHIEENTSKLSVVVEDVLGSKIRQHYLKLEVIF